MKISTKKNMIVLLFIVFIFLRLFVSLPTIRLTSDNTKYLELAKRFPYHTLSNNQLYLQHPPMYPYTIHFLTLLVGKDYLAAILLSLISACITFFIIYRLFNFFTDNFYINFIALLFFTLSVQFIDAGKLPLRESFTVMLTVLALYFYLKGVKLNNKKSIAAASVSGVVLALTTDHVIFLFPAFVLSYIFFNHKKINLRNFEFPNLGLAVLPIILPLIVYGAWIGIKTYQYSTNDYYPAGLEGTPIRTKGFGPIALVSPYYFKDYEPSALIQENIVSRLKNVAFNLGYMFNIEPFSIPKGLNFTTMKFLLLKAHIAYMFFIYLPIAIITAYGFFLIFKNFIKTGKIHNNTNLYVVALFLVFLTPILQKITSPRFLYASYIFLYYVIGYSFVALSKKIKLVEKNTKRLSALFVLFLVLLIPYWYYNNPNFVLFSDKVVGAQNTGGFIRENINKEDAIMAQPGYSYKLLYQTGNRFVGMPSNPQDLMIFIKYYNIKYVVFGRYFTWDNYYYSKDSVEFIRKNPSIFKLVAAIKEDDSPFFPELDKARTDEIYIYKVVA